MDGGDTVKILIVSYLSTFESVLVWWKLGHMLERYEGCNCAFRLNGMN